MSKNQRQFLVSLSQYVLLCISGIAIFCLIAFLDYQGAFITWKPLGNQLKFKQIITANSLAIQAQTIDDKYYSFRLDNFCSAQSECSQWIEVTAASNLDYAGNPLIEKGVSCNEFNRPMFFQKPQGNIIECVHAEEFVIPEMRSIVYYALTDEGKILVWDFTNSFVRARGTGATSWLILIGGALSGAVVIILFKIKQRNFFFQENQDG